MYTILMNSDKSLVASRRIDLYEGDNLVDKIQFLFPQTYKNINLEECTVYFNYIDLTGQECSETLVKDSELYKNKLRYRYPIDSNFTKLYGDIVFDISFFMESEDILFHTEKHVISIIPHLGSIPPTEIIPEESASKILKEVYEIEERVKKIEDEGVSGTIKYTQQTLTDEQKEQVRINIGAIDKNDVLTKNNLEEYIPESDYNPATKKYVDDLRNDFKNDLNNSIVQSDWNQNDDTKNDYIKNRPFYDEIVSEINISVEVGGYGCIGQNQLLYDLLFVKKEFSKLKVTLENITYTLVEKPDYHIMDSWNHVYDLVFVLPDGTLSTRYGIVDYGLPSFIFLDNTKSEYARTVTAKVHGALIDKELKQLDEKYIPDTIQRVSDTVKALEGIAYIEVEDIINFSDGGNFVIDDDGNGNISITSSKIEVKNIDNNVNIISSVLSVVNDENGDITIIEQ